MFLSVLTSLFGGCGDKKPSPIAGHAEHQQTADTEVMLGTGEDFIDLALFIEDHQRQPDGTQIIRAAGKHNSQPIRLEIVLGASWKSGSLDEKIPLVVYQGTVTFRSLGTESDNLVRMLDEVYGTKLNPTAMKQQTRFTAMTLGGDPRDLSKGPVKVKLFFESDNEKEYAELFTNIDLSKHRLEINEKDPDYREAIVQSLKSK